MIYLVDQDEMRRHNTFTRIHSEYPCSTGGCEGTGKGLRVKQPPNLILVNRCAWDLVVGWHVSNVLSFSDRMYIILLY